MRRGEEERTLASAGWPGGLPSKLQVPPGGPAGEEERRGEERRGGERWRRRGERRGEERRGEERRGHWIPPGCPGGLPSKLQAPPGGPAGEEERK